jgi:hypothetical protein
VHVKGYQTALDTKSKTELTRENITKRFNAKRFGSHTNINVELP